MIDPQNLLDMIESGCTVEQIAALCRRLVDRQEEKILAKREGARIRQQECRARKKYNDNNDGVTPVTRDTCDMPRADIKNARAPAVIPVGETIVSPPIDKKTNKKDAAPTGAESDFFDRFWKAFPNRAGKAKALENFLKAIRSGADPEAIIAGAERYAALNSGTEPRFIKHAQGWLTDRRWEDAPPVKTGPPRRHGNWLC